MKEEGRGSVLEEERDEKGKEEKIRPGIGIHSHDANNLGLHSNTSNTVQTSPQKRPTFRYYATRYI